MGTRADFYVGRGEDAEWLGSVGWDGYPDGFSDRLWDAKTEDEWRNAVEAELGPRDDFTRPSDGWPWPWDNSYLTDYSYAFDDGKVYASSFGHEWFEVDPLAAYYGEPEEDDGDRTAVFPDMASRKNVTLGKRSGAIFLRVSENDD